MVADDHGMRHMIDDTDGEHLFTVNIKDLVPDSDALFTRAGLGPLVIQNDQFTSCR